MNAREIADRRVRSAASVRWLFAGDSITQGAAHTNGWRDYTQLFKERLGEMGRNEDVVINTAVGGWSLRRLAEQLDERVSAFAPDVVFLMFGTNDTLASEMGVDEFRQQYETILRVCCDRHQDVIVQTTVPACAGDADAHAKGHYTDPAVRSTKANGVRMRQRFIHAYVEATISAARSMNVALIDHYRTWTARGGTFEELTDGGFHPNAAGHRLLARTLLAEMGLFDPASAVCTLLETQP